MCRYIDLSINLFNVCFNNIHPTPRPLISLVSVLWKTQDENDEPAFLLADLRIIFSQWFYEGLRHGYPYRRPSLPQSDITSLKMRGYYTFMKATFESPWALSKPWSTVFMKNVNMDPQDHLKLTCQFHLLQRFQANVFIKSARCITNYTLKFLISGLTGSIRKPIESSDVSRQFDHLAHGMRRNELLLHRWPEEWSPARNRLIDRYVTGLLEQLHLHGFLRLWICGILSRRLRRWGLTDKLFPLIQKVDSSGICRFKTFYKIIVCLFWPNASKSNVEFLPIFQNYQIAPPYRPQELLTSTSWSLARNKVADIRL